MVLCYFSSHNNSLSEASRSVLNDIRKGGLPATDDDSKILLIYYHLADTVPVLARLSRDGDGQLVETKLMTYPGNGTLSVKSLSAGQLRQVWTDAQTLFPSKKHSLFISSHGSGYLPSGYLSDPEDRCGPVDEDPFRFLVKSDGGTRSIGPDDDLEINNKIKALRSERNKKLAEDESDEMLERLYELNGLMTEYQPTLNMDEEVNEKSTEKGRKGKQALEQSV